MEFQEIYETCYPLVYAFLMKQCANPHLSEELTQETFVRALKAINRFKGECRVETWLCQIAKNTYYTHYKKQRRPLPDVTEAASDTESDFLTKDDALRLHRILHSLDEPYKEVFTLRTFGELPFAQIGELFGKTESWARVTYHRAKLKIKEEFK